MYVAIIIQGTNHYNFLIFLTISDLVLSPMSLTSSQPLHHPYTYIIPIATSRSPSLPHHPYSHSLLNLYSHIIPTLTSSLYISITLTPTPSLLSHSSYHIIPTPMYIIPTHTYTSSIPHSTISHHHHSHTSLLSSLPIQSRYTGLNHTQQELPCPLQRHMGVQ